MSKLNLPESINTLVDALEEDKEPGSYYYSWQANIAMSFKDEWQRTVDTGGGAWTQDQIHEIANKAAQNFLDMLCNVNRYGRKNTK